MLQDISTPGGTVSVKDASSQPRTRGILSSVDVLVSRLESIASRLDVKADELLGQKPPANAGSASQPVVGILGDIDSKLGACHQLASILESLTDRLMGV